MYRVGCCLIPRLSAPDDCYYRHRGCVGAIRVGKVYASLNKRRDRYEEGRCG